MLDRAETLLHDHYAGKDYWDVSEMSLHYCTYVACHITVFQQKMTQILFSAVFSLSACSPHCLIFDADQTQHGFRQTPATHWGQLQGQAPELNR